MASKPAITRHQLKGEVKQKNMVADGRNRRVLQDIGNLVNERGAGQVNNKKQITEAVKVVGARRVPAITKKAVVEKHEPEEVIIISSDDESDKKIKQVSTRRNAVKTLTQILTARSKAASGLTRRPEINLEMNIDEDDSNNELAVVEYVDDIYNFYKHSEADGRVHDYMHLQPDINSKMRSILIDWLIEVHRKFDLMPETLYLTINIIDRFLAVKAVARKELQLVGISSMLIACKYEEIWAPEVNDFICISDNAYIREQVLQMEKSILEKLEWYLSVPTPYVFLVRFIKASVQSDNEMENMVFFLAELGLMQYPVAITYLPSLLAASAVYAARCTLDKRPFWTQTLQHHTGYTEDVLIECAKLLVKFHSAAVESKLKAVHKKFSNTERGSVALRSPAKYLSE
ncbi:Cyclin family protein [Euphorbia peplus]|nr:Cyclin family protein [Euphorbia peplus]